jgi:hypothetical protein
MRNADQTKGFYLLEEQGLGLGDLCGVESEEAREHRCNAPRSKSESKSTHLTKSCLQVALIGKSR